MREEPLLAVRRDLPGSPTLLIILEPLGDGRVRGELRAERRKDTERSLEGTPPLLAEVVSASRTETLAVLRRITQDPGEIRARLRDWRPGRDPLPVELPAGMED